MPLTTDHRPLTTDYMFRLLIVDDSPYYRMRFTRIVARSAQLDVAGVADDGDVAIKRIVELAPDIVLLDLMMPRMDGFGVLRWVMAHRPLPVVVCSSFSDRDRVFKALELGAIDFLLKPTPQASTLTSMLEAQMIERLEEAARAQLPTAMPISPDAKAAVLAAERSARGARVELICIAASTGGPAALQKLVANLPKSLAVPLIVVQHMPAGFTRPFAERLNTLSHYTVREARDGDAIRKRHLYVAPAGKLTTIVKDDIAPALSVTDEVGAQAYTPSADALFASAAATFGARALAVVLTGMGEDGARGAESLRAAGGHVIAESNESAIVFGMPRSVIERGAASASLPLAAMPPVLLAFTLKD